MRMHASIKTIMRWLHMPPISPLSIAASAFTSTLMAKHSLSSTLPKSPRPTQPFSASPSITLPASCKCDLAAHGLSFVTSLTEQTRCSTDKPCARAAGEGGEALRLHDPHGPTASDLGIAPKDVHQGRKLREAEKAEPGLVRRTVSIILQSPSALTASSRRLLRLYTRSVTQRNTGVAKREAGRLVTMTARGRVSSVSHQANRDGPFRQ